MSSGRAPCWDVFCRVVDNYGDAAVCWRLARQLATEHGIDVRLWVDNLATLHALCCRVDPTASTQVVDGVLVRRWQQLGDALSGEVTEAADVVVDAFGAGLPEGYVAAMVQREPSSLWIILEYLSAESWVSSHHGLASPHPSLPLRRFFFFPGFGSDTGGVLREAGLLQRRDGFQHDASVQARFWQSMGFASPSPDATVISLFGYESTGVTQFLDVWAQADKRIVAAVPDSRLRPQVLAFFDVTSAVDGDTLRRGNLEVRLVPFLTQQRYDELLWASDWNFVRGEDSFVRAQWAAQPLVWNIYPQEERAHWPKLDAFLDRYCAGMDPGLTRTLRTAWHVWNGGLNESFSVADWHVLQKNHRQLKLHAQKWAIALQESGDLAAKLVQFCKSKVK